MSNFLSGVALMLSVLACLFSGFAAYRVFSIEQAVETSSRAVEDLGKAQASPTSNDTAASASSNPSPTPANITSSANNTGIQPGQFVQPTLGNLGRIELLAVKRVQDPKTGTRDVVNVMFRVYRVAEDLPGVQLIGFSSTSARNPDTSEVYEAYGDRKFAGGGTVLLSLVKKDIPEDGYVWLKVPEAVNTLDILIPETQAFKNVPIAN
jgi:hypothetical protein